MSIISNLGQEDTEKIADIIVSFSIIDDMLCNYILEYNKLTHNKVFAGEAKKLKDDRSNVGIGDKIECFVSIYPNHGNPDNGKKIKNLKGKLCDMRDYRNEVAHNRRFSLKNGSVFLDHRSYNRQELPLDRLHKQYEKRFRDIEPILKAFYSEYWDYREYFLYDLKDEEYYE